MSEQAKNVIPISDAQAVPADQLPLSMARMVEITHVHIYHAPGTPTDINGFTFVLRDGDAEYTVALREGVKGDGVEPVDATPIETGSPTYVDLMEARGESVDALITRMAGIGPLLADLVSDLKA